MTPVMAERPAIPEHAEIRRIADDVAGALKYSICGVLADLTADTGDDSAERVLRGLIGRFPRDGVRVAKTRAQALLASDQLVREHIFGTAGRVPVADYIADGGARHHIRSASGAVANRRLLGVSEPTITVSLDHVEEIDGGFALRQADGTPLTLDEARRGFTRIQQAAAATGVIDQTAFGTWGDHGFTPIKQGRVTLPPGMFPVHERLELYVDIIQCKKVTDGLGDDEIRLAGLAIDNTGTTSPIHDRLVGEGFTDWTVKYLPDISFATFDLTNGTTWPKLFQVAFLLSEEDCGVFGDELTAFWNSVRDDVLDAISSLVGDLVAAYLGDTIGNAFGEVVAYLIVLVADFVVGLFGDDFFPPRVVALDVPHPAAFFAGDDNQTGISLRSEFRYLHFFGHGGHYRMTYHWEYVAAD